MAEVSCRPVTSTELLHLTDRGLHCPAGDFYVDPWQEVERAIVTHAHADHARPGSRHYLTNRSGESVLRLRMGPEASIQALDYGETVVLGDEQNHGVVHEQRRRTYSLPERVQARCRVIRRRGEFFLRAHGMRWI